MMLMEGFPALVPVEIHGIARRSRLILMQFKMWAGRVLAALAPTHFKAKARRGLGPGHRYHKIDQPTPKRYPLLRKARRRRCSHARGNGACMAKLPAIPAAPDEPPVAPAQQEPKDLDETNDPDEIAHPPPRGR